MSGAASSSRGRVRPDRLETARTVLLSIFVWILFCTGSLVVDVALRGGDVLRSAKTVMRSAGLSTLALVPSGRRPRLPGVETPGIDPRHVPGLHRRSPDPGEMLAVEPEDFPFHGY